MEKAKPALPRIPTAESQKPLKLVRLNGNYGNLMDGEIGGFPPEEAKYLLEGRHGDKHPRKGQPFGHEPTPEEHEQIKGLKEWQSANDLRTEAQAVQRQGGIIAAALDKRNGK